MVLDKLGSSLRGTLQKIASSVFVDDKLINELVKDIQRALIQSDVNVKLVFSLSNEIKNRIKSEDTPPGLTKKEHLINIVYEELIKFLGGEYQEIKVDKTPTKIMLVGLFGNGKTTTAGKLAKYFKKRGHKVAVIQTDTWRPAAYHQLKQLAEQIEVDFYGSTELKNPTEIFKQNEDRLNYYDVIIVDTAGRDALNDELVEELNVLNEAVKADHRLLVMSGDIGQAAFDQAKKFNDTCDVTGVIITKLDGTAKGGGALSACSATNAHVKFVGVGEKVDDLEAFEPKRFVGRLLGMGDIETLLEKAKDAFKDKDMEDMGKKFLKGEFNLIDLYEQMASVRKMGPLKKVMEMIPGFSSMNLPKDMLDVQEKKLDLWKHILNSCTRKELEDPSIISHDRVERISAGSGVSIKEIRELLKQYKQSKKMVKMFKGKGANSKKDMEKMMKQFKGKIPGL